MTLHWPLYSPYISKFLLRSEHSYSATLLPFRLCIQVQILSRPAYGLTSWSSKSNHILIASAGSLCICRGFDLSNSGFFLGYSRRCRACTCRWAERFFRLLKIWRKGLFDFSFLRTGLTVLNFRQFLPIIWSWSLPSRYRRQTSQKL